MPAGTKEDPWLLKTPPGTSEYSMHKDPQATPPALVWQAGSTTLKFHLRAAEELHAWLSGRTHPSRPQQPDPDRSADKGNAL